MGIKKVTTALDSDRALESEAEDQFGFAGIAKRLAPSMHLGTLALMLLGMCLPLHAADMHDAVDKVFGVANKLYLHELNIDWDGEYSQKIVSIKPPVTSNKFKSYAAIINERYGTVCAIQAEFSHDGKDTFKDLSQSITDHFKTNGTSQSANNMNQSKRMAWTGNAMPKNIKKVILSQSSKGEKRNAVYATTLTMQFDDYDKCMHVDKKYEDDRQLFSQEFRCDVVSSTYINKHGIQFIDTSPPLLEYKDTSNAHLLFEAERYNKRDVFRFKFQATVPEYHHDRNLIDLRNVFYRTHYHPKTWAAKHKDVSFRAFPKKEKNGPFVMIGDTGFVYRKNNDDLTIIKAGNVLTGVATEELGDESYVTHFTCDIREEDWKNVTSGFYQEAKRYTIEENGEITEGF